REYGGSRVLAQRDACVQELRHLDEARAEDDGRRQKEREARGLLVTQAGDKPATDRDPGARDAGDEGERLAGADDGGGDEADPLGLSEMRLLLGTSRATFRPPARHLEAEHQEA